MKMSKHEKKMRKSVKKTAKLLGRRGLTSGMRSSVSQRLESGHFQMTPRGVYLRNMKKKMVVTLDATGNPVYHRYGWQPNDDLPLHLAVYQARGDVNGIIHAHPPYLAALGLAVDALDYDRLPAELQTLGRALVVDQIDVQTGDVPTNLLNALTNGNVVLLPGNGVLVAGRSLDHAYAQLDEMEHHAQVFEIAKSVGLIA